MAKTDHKTADDYVATLAAADQVAINALRKTVREALPEAEEVISYQLPAFKLDGWVCYLSAWSKHYGLSVPPPATTFEHFAAELEPYEVTKSMVRLPKSMPLPLDLIARIVAFRAAENRRRNLAAKAKR